MRGRRKDCLIERVVECVVKEKLDSYICCLTHDDNTELFKHLTCCGIFHCSCVAWLHQRVFFRVISAGNYHRVQTNEKHVKVNQHVHEMERVE
jgi:hypothetical protein